MLIILPIFALSGPPANKDQNTGFVCQLFISQNTEKLGKDKQKRSFVPQKKKTI